MQHALRRYYCVLISMMLASLGGLTIVSLCSGQSSWPQFGGTQANFQVAATPVDAQRSGLVSLWQSQVGTGKASPVVDGDQVFIAFRRELETQPDAPPAEPASKIQYLEGIQARQLATGELQWEFSETRTELDKQESFSGDPRAPQATPLIHQGQLFTLGFTGVLTALDSRSGKRLWEIDLVGQWQATPVQFGFSASPIMVNETLIVLAGGPNAGLCGIDPQRGEIKWRCPLDPAGYATPVSGNIGGVPHVLVVTENQLVAIDPASGQRLWSFDFPEAGLTNVPQPLIVAADQVCISGQGCQGTLMLQVGLTDGKWQTSVLWKNEQVRFFYNNWLVWDDTLIFGCTENGITLLRRSDGREVGKFRVATDGNALRISDRQLLVCSGKGICSLLERSDSGFLEVARWPALSQRVWAPLAFVAPDIYLIRGGDQVAAFALRPGDGIANQLKAVRDLPLKRDD